MSNEYGIEIGDLLYDLTFDRVGWVYSISDKTCNNHWSDGNYSWNSYYITTTYKDEAFFLNRKILRETKK